MSRGIRSALGGKNIGGHEMIVALVLTWEEQKRNGNEQEQAHQRYQERAEADVGTKSGNSRNSGNSGNSGILEHASVAGKTSVDEQSWMNEVLDMLSTTCTLSLIPPSKQAVFPPSFLSYSRDNDNSSSSVLATSKTKSAANERAPPPLQSPISSWTPTLPHPKVQTFAVLSSMLDEQTSSDMKEEEKEKEEEEDGDEDDEKEEEEEEEEEKNSALPPLPNYCPSNEKFTTNPLAPRHTVRVQHALRAYHESLFIEENAQSMQFPIPFVDTILEFIMKLVLPAILNPFAEYYVKEVSGRVSDEMGHKIVADVPTDVVKLLTPPLTYNVSNLLTDALTASVSKSLIHHLPWSLVHPLSRS